jgi:hypothetical protein
MLSRPVVVAQQHIIGCYQCTHFAKGVAYKTHLLLCLVLFWLRPLLSATALTVSLRQLTAAAAQQHAASPSQASTSSKQPLQPLLAAVLLQLLCVHLALIKASKQQCLSAAHVTLDTSHAVMVQQAMLNVWLHLAGS